MVKESIVAILLIGVAGCGTQADPRLLVTDRLRVACAAPVGYYTDEQILGIINLGETDRLNGLAYADALLIIIDSCNSQQATQEGAALCQSCGFAVANQIYGY